MKCNLKSYNFNICLIFFINLFLVNANAVNRIILIGDSILDNAYWNNVGANTTGQCLVKMLNTDKNDILLPNGTEVLIDDRSVEENTASAIVRALETNGKVYIPMHGNNGSNGYIGRRKINGVAYNSNDKYSARLNRYCKIDETKFIAEVDILSDIKDSYVFVSAGGNDLLLNSTYPTTIINNIKKIGALYKKLGAKKVIYIIPYTMTNKVGYFLSYAINSCRFICKWLYFKNMSKEFYDDIIDLSDFDDTLRASEYIIPEPTIKGAERIAELIAKRYSFQINN